MKRVVRLAAVVAAAVCGLAAAAPAAQALVLTPVDTFSAPIYAASPPGDGRRLMVVERAGTIRVVRDGQTLPTPFLDITPLVDAGGEGGLLSVAFPPGYVSSGLFYVFLTPKDTDPSPAPIEVREYRRASGQPDRADPASGRTVIQIAHGEFANHYGGGLQFGPDGMLYISTGDGGGAGDPGANGQDKDSRLGKILRIDPRRSGASPYSVPADNPFVGAAGDDLVWAYGLRNPFRFSFDRETGDLTIGDVGQNAIEEVDFARGQDGRGRGLNFGWSACEGPLAYPVTAGRPACALTGHTGPVLSYDATAPCNAVTGGVVVRDPGLEELAGRYIYGDYCHGFVRHAQLAVPTATDDDDSGIAIPGFNLVAFGEDACGRVHLVELGSGLVSRLEDDSPLACEQTVAYPSAGAAGYPGLSGGGPSGPASGAPADMLRVLLGGARRQRALRRRAVLVRVRCSAACRASARGTLSVRAPSGRRLTLAGTVRTLAADRRVTLRLRLSRRARAAVARRLRRGGRVRATITVRVRDASGSATDLTRTVRIVG